MIERDHDNGIFVYVLRVDNRYEYIPHMVCVAKNVRPPDGAVFVVYACVADEKSEHGTIIGFDWVTSDPTRPSYPESWQDRYEREVFSNG